MSKLSFDANKVQPQAPMDPVPAGWYSVVISKSEVKPTKAKPGKKAGSRLELEFTVIDGEFKGRKVFDGLNIENDNPVAADIGQQQLSAICHATGVFKVTDTAQLHDKPFEIKVGLEGARSVLDGKTVAAGTPGATDYEPRNGFRGARALEGATPTPGAAQPGWVKPASTPPPEEKVKAPPAKTKAPAKEAKKKWVLINAGNEAGEFWVAVTEGEDPQDLKAPDILEMLDKGMPPDTAVMLQGGDDTWQTAGDFFHQVDDTPPPVEEKKTPAKVSTPAKNAPPWAKK